MAALLAANGFTRSLVLGYGPAARWPRPPPRCARRCRTRRPRGRAIRVAEGRWWSLTCDDDCCPPEGTPYDISASALAAQATFAGHVALADRAELVASVAPIGGPAMHRATERAEKRRLACPRVDAESDLAFVLALLAHVRTGIRPTDDEVAWLGLLLTDLRIRDEAWIRIDEDAPAADIAFWRDIVRRVDERHVPAPASLLAFAAYTAGRRRPGQRGPATRPRRRPRLLHGRPAPGGDPRGHPPSKLRLGMNPDQLATAYDAHPHRKAG